MQRFTTLADAIELAKFAHRNQVDKAGLPYIRHPMRVLDTVRSQAAPVNTQIAAVLHDITEDTAFTCPMLLKLGFPGEAVALVTLMDRHAVTYDDPDDYYRAIAKNPQAVMIKLADIMDNLMPERLARLEREVQDRLRTKYQHAIAVMTGNVSAATTSVAKKSHASCPEAHLHTKVEHTTKWTSLIGGRPASDLHYQVRCPGCGLFLIWIPKPTCPECQRPVGRHGHRRPRHKQSLGGPICPGGGQSIPALETKAALHCHAGRDGECYWPDCPQNRDGEPKATGRDCPLWTDEAR